MNCVIRRIVSSSLRVEELQRLSIVAELLENKVNGLIQISVLNARKHCNTSLNTFSIVR